MYHDLSLEYPSTLLGVEGEQLVKSLPMIAYSGRA